MGLLVCLFDGTFSLSEISLHASPFLHDVEFSYIFPKLTHYQFFCQMFSELNTLLIHGKLHYHFSRILRNDLAGFMKRLSFSKAFACNVGDLCLIPGLGRSPGEGICIYSSTLFWKISWMEEPGSL